MPELLKGKPVADALTEDIRRRADALAERGITPTLAIVRVGENESDLSYIRGALSRCEKCGIEVVQKNLPDLCSQEQLEAVIDEINADPGIDGCLLLRPLPRHIDERAICNRLKAAKDMDCITDASLSTVFTGRGEGFAPCTAQAVIEILNYYGVDAAGKNAAVIGRSLVIGKPVSMLLQQRDATVTMCHSRTQNIAALCSQADLLIAAVGKAGFVGPEFTNPNQVIIDVGINVTPEGKLTGDVDFDAVADGVKAISPVPGGVGGVTTAVLCKHLMEAAERAAY